MRPGRPTDYLPRLEPTDVLYACGAPGLVDSIKSIAAQAGAVCYADPFVPTIDDPVEESVLSRAMGWLVVPAKRQLAVHTKRVVPSARQMGQLALDRPRNRREQPIPAYRIAEARDRMAEARMRSHYRY